MFSLEVNSPGNPHAPFLERRRAPSPPTDSTPHFLNSVLDELDYGVLICTSANRILNLNLSAKTELATARVLTSINGVLQATSATDRDKIQKAIRRALVGYRTLISIGEGKNLISGALVPLNESETHQRVLLLLGRRQPYAHVALEMFGNLHGLTLSEKRVLLALLEGQRPAEAASQYGVALSTIRTQIASIREKLCVRGVEDLTNLVAGLPPLTTITGHGRE